MKLTYKTMEQAIQTVRARYLEEGKVMTITEIHTTFSTEFTQDVMKELGVSTVSVESVECWQLEQLKDGETGKWQTELVEDLLESYPPFDLTWKKFDKIAFEPHQWISFNGNHYDAECEQGVCNVFELPRFKRIIEAHI